MADQREYCYKCLCYINHGQFLVQLSEYQFTKRSVNSVETNTWLSISLNNLNGRVRGRIMMKLMTLKFQGTSLAWNPSKALGGTLNKY